MSSQHVVIYSECACVVSSKHERRSLLQLPGRLFRSTKPHGMGVGLALSHATVERLGGELAMEPADGRGVRVRFSIPADAPAVAP